jgi:hypothetical protein
MQTISDMTTWRLVSIKVSEKYYWYDYIKRLLIWIYEEYYQYILYIIYYIWKILSIWLNAGYYRYYSM